MNCLKSMVRWINDDAQHVIGVRLLHIGFGIFLLYRVMSEAPFALYLWGPNGIGEGSMTTLFGTVLGGLLDGLFRTNIGTYAVLAALAAGAFAMVAGMYTRWAVALSLITFVMIERRHPEIPDGGDNIVRIVLIYMLFLIPYGKKVERGSMQVWFHNTAVMAIVAQVCVLYTVSGFMKAAGRVWNNGTAMYLISQVEWFSHPAMRDIFTNDAVATFATYSAMFYQCWFVMALGSRARIPWLCIGMLFHLNIAIFMGLVTFSTAMISLELFLIADFEYATGRRFAASVAERLRGLRERFSRSRSPQPELAPEAEART